MWDLTPDTDLLKELPEEYTFETALADLIDNSLQAVWSKSIDQRRLIRALPVALNTTLKKEGISLPYDPRVTILNAPVKTKQEYIGFYPVAIASPKGRQNAIITCLLCLSLPLCNFLLCMNHQLDSPSGSPQFPHNNRGHYLSGLRSYGVFAFIFPEGVGKAPQ
ncbi:hypothetical protein H5410_017089 [Solanum commersonii]|uniref:Uncharacterized protein n=1 Tax=Solanum commersonii TaxID=4109 RepID=A0A9J5ZYB3_SOLCO|nr:hypothetical protein H5410_017089 [Solanum commersonii]